VTFVTLNDLFGFLVVSYGAIHILRQNDFGLFSDPTTHYVSTVLNVGKNDHVLDPPTHPIQC
jgi:hypothetical protein